MVGLSRRTRGRLPPSSPHHGGGWIQPSEGGTPRPWLPRCGTVLGKAYIPQAPLVRGVALPGEDRGRRRGGTPWLTHSTSHTGSTHAAPVSVPGGGKQTVVRSPPSCCATRGLLPPLPPHQIGTSPPPPTGCSSSKRGGSSCILPSPSCARRVRPPCIGGKGL